MSTKKTEQEMPLLVVEATGEITASNFAEFALAAREWLGGINRELKTDEDFDQAAADAKKAKLVEDLLAETRDAVLSKAETLNAELAKFTSLSAEMREARLELTRQIDKAKEDRREAMIVAALPMVECAPALRVKYRPIFEAAMKGLKTIESMREKIRISVSVANDNIRRNVKILDEFEAANGRTMTADREALEISDAATLPGELRRRGERAEHEAEAKRLRDAAAAAKAASDAELAKARAEADKARSAAAALPPAQQAQAMAANPGPPAMIEPLPPEEKAEQTEAEEWGEFKAAFFAALTVAGTIRRRFVHPANVRRGDGLSAGIAAIWKEVAP